MDDNSEQQPKQIKEFAVKRQDSIGIVKSIWANTSKNELAAKGMSFTLTGDNKSDPIENDDDIEFLDPE